MHRCRSKMETVDKKSRILQNYTYWSLTDGYMWFMLGFHFWLENVLARINILLQCLKATHATVGWSSKAEIKTGKDFVQITRRKWTALFFWLGWYKSNLSCEKQIKKQIISAWSQLCWSAKENVAYFPVALTWKLCGWLSEVLCQSLLAWLWWFWIAAGCGYVISQLGHSKSESASIQINAQILYFFLLYVITAVVCTISECIILEVMVSVTQSSFENPP